MKLLIFRARPEDLKVIQELNFKLFKKEHREYDSTLNLEWTFSRIGEKYFLDKIKNGFAAIAEVGGEPVGYLVGSTSKDYPYRLTKRTAELGNMFVLDRYRNRGIGTKLVKSFLDWCRKNDYKHINVAASALNKKGISFYRKLGFKDYTVTLEINPKNKRV